MIVLEQIKDKYMFVIKKINLEKTYTIDYDKKLKNYYSEEVFKKRREFVEKYTKIDNSFDYGAGRKPFWEFYNLPIGGCWDKYIKKYNGFPFNKFIKCDTILMFDIVEHLFGLDDFLRGLPQTKMIITVPIVPMKFNSVKELESWSHYKPGEHLRYWTLDGFYEYIENVIGGWKIKEYSTCECPPRKDIGSFYIERL